MIITIAVPASGSYDCNDEGVAAIEILTLLPAAAAASVAILRLLRDLVASRVEAARVEALQAQITRTLDAEHRTAQTAEEVLLSSGLSAENQTLLKSVLMQRLEGLPLAPGKDGRR